MTDVRFPAEWEPQSAILIAWPHPGTDWAPRLESVEETYIALVAGITRFEPVVICVADSDLQIYAEARLRSARIDMSKVHFVEAPYNDTWLRDSGPISLLEKQGFKLMDFRFTGWGGKYEASLDDLLVGTLADTGMFVNAQVESVDFALEGGGIETDGTGTLLTTWRCLHERHPETSREQISDTLKSTLRQQRVLWLDHGYLEGDDTDAHIDTLARFAPNDAIVYQACNDQSDTHHTELSAMGAEISALRTITGKPYTLYPLPWAQPVLDGGRRLAASYANFLILNGAVLIPAYEDPADEVAAAVIAKAYPGREIVQIPCRPLIWQNGSLHCVTMQLPEGLLSL